MAGNALILGSNEGGFLRLHPAADGQIRLEVGASKTPSVICNLDRDAVWHIRNFLEEWLRHAR